MTTKIISILLVRRICRKTLKYFFLIVDFFLVLLSHEMILLILIIYLKNKDFSRTRTENCFAGPRPEINSINQVTEHRQGGF